MGDIHPDISPEEIANQFFGHISDRFEAWELAFELILYHEYFHFLSQYHCDRLSTSQPHDQKYWDYILDWMKDPPMPSKRPLPTPMRFENSVLPWTKKHKSKCRCGMRSNPRLTMNTAFTSRLRISNLVKPLWPHNMYNLMFLTIRNSTPCCQRCSSRSRPSLYGCLWSTTSNRNTMCQNWSLSLRFYSTET